MEGVRGDDSSPAIDRCRIGMRAVDEIRQREYDKLCSEGRWTSPFAFITEDRLRRSEWGSFTAQQIYIRDFLVSRGSDKKRTSEEEARAKLAYVYRSGEVRLCTHPGDLEEMTESDDEDLRAQSTPGFYDHSSRLNWRHSLVELPRNQKERERFKAVIEMRNFCFVLVDERTKAGLDYFQSLPAQARHSIAQTKPATWRVFEEAPVGDISPTSSSMSSTLSVCDLASTMSACDLGSATPACDILEGDEESAGEKTLPSPRPSIGYESSATDDEGSDGEGSRWPSSSTFGSPPRRYVKPTPCCGLNLPNDLEGREKAPVDESDGECFDGSDSPPQDGHRTNSSPTQDSIISAGCSRRSMKSQQRLGSSADGTIQAGTSGRGGGGGRGSKDGGMYVGADFLRETGLAGSRGRSVGIGGDGGGGARAAASGDIRRSTPPAATSWVTGLMAERAATSSVTDGGGSTEFSGGSGSRDNHHPDPPNPPKGRLRQKACVSASTWTSQQQDYNVPNSLLTYQGRASPARKTTSMGAGNSKKDKSTCGMSRSRPLTSTFLLSTTTSDSDGHGNSNGGGGNGCAAVEEPVTEKTKNSCRSSVETIPTGRGRCLLRTRRPVVPQSQAKAATPLSDSSSVGGEVDSIRSRRTCISSRKNGRTRNGDGKAIRKKAALGLTVPLEGGSEEPSDCPAASRKNASVMTVPLNFVSKGTSGCPLDSRKDASAVAVPLKSGISGRSSCPAETAVEHAGGGGDGGGDGDGDGGDRGGGGARGFMASVGAGMTDGLLLNDAVVTTSTTTESAVPHNMSTVMNDSVCSSGVGSQMGDQDGVKTRTGLPLFGTSADNGIGARTGLTPADHCVLFGFGPSESGDDDDSREERHLQKENKGKGGDAKPSRGSCGKEGVLPTTAISGNVPKAQPGPYRADDRAAIPGPLLRQETLLLKGMAREPKQEAAIKTMTELRREDSKESRLPPRLETLPGASESRANAASKTEADVTHDSAGKGSMLRRPKTQPRGSGSRAKARAARYAAAKRAAEKVLKDAMEAIEIHNNALVELARHQCAEVEVKTAENEQASALLHNRLLISKVHTEASARNHHIPTTENPRLCTRVREVRIGAMSSAVASERHRGFLHGDDIDSRQVIRSGSLFRARQSAERESDGARRLSGQEETAAAPEVQLACLSALQLVSAHDGRDTAEPAAEMDIVDAKRAAERTQVAAEFAATALSPRYAKENTAAVARATTGVAHQEEIDHRTKEARDVLGGSSFLERDAKEKDAMKAVASDCRKTHLGYLKRQKAFEQSAWRVADTGMKSARAVIAAEFASIRLHLSQQHAAQLAFAARATAKTSDVMDSLTRRVSVLEEEGKDDRRRMGDSSLEEDCHAEAICRIAAMRSRKNARTAARLGVLKNS